MKDSNITALIIAVLVTFVVTVILVAATLVIAFGIHRAYKSRKGKPSATNPGPIEPVSSSINLYSVDKSNL